MNVIKIVLPLIPQFCDMVEILILKQTGNENDRWVRIGNKALQAAIAQMIIEFKLDK